MATVSGVVTPALQEWSGRAPTRVQFAGVPYVQDRRHMAVRDYLLRVMLEELFRLDPHSPQWLSALESCGNRRIAQGAWVRGSLVVTRKLTTHTKRKSLKWNPLLPLPLDVFDPEALAAKLATVELDHWKTLLRRAQANPVGPEKAEVDTALSSHPLGFDFEAHHARRDQHRYAQARAIIDRFHEKAEQVK